VWGISFALLEHSVYDDRLGRIVNNNLAEYHVPTNADVGSIEALWVDEVDDHVSPIGAKGFGEIGITGAAAAIGKLQGYPVFSAATRLLGFRRFAAGVQVLTPAEIGSGPFFAFCGIGNPRAFFLDLQNWHIPVAGKKTFPDHHRYTPAEVQSLVQSAQQSGARALVTTEKDAQNLGQAQFGDTPVFVSVIDLEISPETEFWEAVQAQLVASAPSRMVN